MTQNERVWDQEYLQGKWAFLGSPKEQVRLACIAAFIASYGPGHVVDLGAGTGNLLNWINPDAINHYTALDVSESALAQIPEQSFPVTAVASEISNFSLGNKSIGTLVASEVLCYIDNPAGELSRLVNEAQKVDAVVVSLVQPREDKPKWERASKRVWGGIDDLGWKPVQSVVIEDHETSTSWKIALFTGAALGNKID